MEIRKFTTHQMTRIAIITALLCVLAPVSIPIPISPVPISLANFVLFLSVFVLEWKSATISCILYLIIGAIGLPVFSGFSGGVAKLLGPTGGYLIGYVFLVLISGFFMHIGRKKVYYFYYITGIIIGEVALYIPGTLWLAHSLNVSFKEGLFLGVIPYLPGDIVKALIAMKIGQVIRTRLTIALGKDPIE